MSSGMLKPFPRGPMKHAWELPKQESMTTLVSNRKVREVLIEYEGPQLEVLEEGSSQFLALAVDSDDEAVRWVQSPASQLEVQALKLGAVSVRSAILKPRILLADYSYDDRPLHVWEITKSSIPPDALPERSALLPGSNFHPPVTLIGTAQPAFFSLGTPDEHSQGAVSFGRLSAIMSTLQALWNAIAPMYGAERAQLSAESAERGSFKLRLHLQDPNLFSRIASTYRDLIEATYDSERLTEVLDKAAPGVKFAYEDFLETLDFNEVEVLAQWHEGAAYVDYETAQETRPAVRGLIEQASPVLKETASLRGLLVGYTRKAPRFEFYNLDTSEIIRGTITRELQRNLPFDQEIVLGRSRVYSVRVEITRRGEEPPKYKLLAFTPLESR
jgi:hypothetical protein